MPVQARANGSTDRLRAPLEAMRLLRQVLPLVVLGGGRLATHWVIDYQVRQGGEWMDRWKHRGRSRGPCVVGLRQGRCACGFLRGLPCPVPIMCLVLCDVLL